MGAAPRWREEVIVLKIIYIWGGGSLGSLVGRVKGPAFVLVILVLRECIWNAPSVSLVLPSFDHTGSLGSPPHRVVYPPISPLGDCLPFPYEK